MFRIVPEERLATQAVQGTGIRGQLRKSGSIPGLNEQQSAVHGEQQYAVHDDRGQRLGRSD